MQRQEAETLKAEEYSNVNEDDSEEENEEDWAKQQGVPAFSEPMIQKYLDGRDALIEQEKKQRSDHAFRQTLSPMAAEASALISAIRFEEQQTLWNQNYEDNLARSEPAQVYPGMMFSMAKERMESSKLWRIVKKMPKGALLHCHLEAMVDLDWLIKETLSTVGMCISAQEPLSTEAARITRPFKFQFRSGRQTAESSTIWSTEYRSGQWMPIKLAAETFPSEGTEGFKKWLKARVTITPTESINHHTGPNEIWRKFTSCFPILASIQHYEPIFRKFIRRMLTQLHLDGVQWVDIRANFIVPFWKEGTDEPDEDYEGMLAALQEEIKLFKASDEGKGFWGARLIWTCIRAFDTRKLVEGMRDCIFMKERFPDLICGFDLVGQEDLGRSLANLLPELFWFKKACAEEGIDIPFYFHAGETLGDGDEVDENLFDAIVLGTRRIGHGFSLYKHPLLVDMVKEKRILVESCPISNEVLRLTGSIMSHPLPALLARGVPCCLCNDDPTILGHAHTGMTHDFWQALQGWENLGLPGLANLAENSVRWASFEDCSVKEWKQQIKDGAFGKGNRAARLQQWAQDFEAFCQWVVLEFGPEHEINTLD